MKGYFPIAVFLLAMCPFTFAQGDLKSAKAEFTRLQNELTGANMKSDILFLLDSSGSLGAKFFNAEKEFVRYFLYPITVSYRAARVEVIPFGTFASRYIDGVSNPSFNQHKCNLEDRFRPLNNHLHGYMRNTKAAFQLAYEVCFGSFRPYKRSQVKTVVILITDGIGDRNWNWPLQDPSPVPIAKRLYENHVEVIAIGIGLGVQKHNLLQLVQDSHKQAFYLQNFDQLRELSRHIRGGKFCNIQFE